MVQDWGLGAGRASDWGPGLGGVSRAAGQDWGLPPTSAARSPGRSPGRAPSPPQRPGRPHRGRRSTADAVSGAMQERLSALQAELGSPGAGGEGGPVFTSRPPSSASEVEIELASGPQSAVGINHYI